MLYNRNKGKEVYPAPESTGIQARKSRKAIIYLSILLACAMTVSGCNAVSITNYPASSEESSENISSSVSSDSIASPSSVSAGSKPASSSSSNVSATATPAPTNASEIKYMYVNVNTANVRTEPGTGSTSEVIGQLHYRARVRRILINDKWSKVITDDDETGFVYSEFLSATIPSITPTASASMTLTKWPAVSTLTQSYHAANLSNYIGRAFETGYKPLKGITVIIDPGHGGADPGAVYNNTVMEKTINLAVSLKLGTKLTELGAEVVYTRSTDITLGLYYRNAFINKYILSKHKAVLADKGEDTQNATRLIGLMDKVMNLNTDTISKGGRGAFLGIGVNEDIRTSMDISREYEDIIVLSIHCNSIENSPSTNGVEVYYGTNSEIYQDEKRLAASEDPSNPINPEYQYYNDSARKKLAVALRDGIRKETGRAMRGAGDGVYSWNFCMLRENNLTSALIELGFISSAKDRNYLLDRTNQEKMALGIAKSIYNYYCVH